MIGDGGDLTTRIIASHLHNRERWFGVAVVPNAEIHVADGLLATVSNFEADAGNDTWGAWVP